MKFGFTMEHFYKVMAEVAERGYVFTCFKKHRRRTCYKS